MPLTIAHPIAVLPLRKWAIPLSALVAGSVSPDLEYLFYLAPSGTISHSVTGLFFFCLPAGLAALLVYQWLWKPAALSVIDDGRLPEEHPREAFGVLPVRRFGLICAGILIGAFSHLLWDSFTHDYGWVVRHIDALSTEYDLSVGNRVPVFKVLQHGSTAFGFVVLSILAYRERAWFRSLPPTAWLAAVLVCSVSVPGAIAYALMRTSRPVDPFSWHVFLGYGVITFFMLTLTMVTLLSLAWRVRKMLSAQGSLRSVS